MTLHLTIKPITEWLAISTAGIFVLGFLLMFLTGSRLEIGALMFPAFGTVIAGILLLLTLGSLL